MNINFSETYKSLRTAELMNIVQQANNYEPEAVLAAIAILKGRNITAEDHQYAEQMMADERAAWPNGEKYVKTISNKIERLVEPIVQPETTINIQKWMNILTVALGLLALWKLLQFIIRWTELPEERHFKLFRLAGIIESVYLFITVGGLYKIRKWGWCMLMIYFIIRTISQAFGIFLSLLYSFPRVPVIALLPWLLMYGGLIYLLSREPVRIYFNINGLLLRNTVFTGIILFLGIEVIYKYFFYA